MPILVYNAGDHDKGFAICLQCGYADSEKNLAPGDLPSGFKQHARLTATSERFPCWGRDHTPPLRNQTMAARETTDVLLLAFSGQLSALTRNEELMQTLGYALQIAGAKLLELDTRELGVMVSAAEEFGVGVGAVIYDNVPGGAGHVRELFARKREWLEVGLDVLFVNERHNAICETACLDCLLTFDAQEAMNRGLLQRNKAYRVLNELLEGNAIPQQVERLGETAHQSAVNLQKQPMSKEERLNKGQARLRNKKS